MSIDHFHITIDGVPKCASPLWTPALDEAHVWKGENPYCCPLVKEYITE